MFRLLFMTKYRVKKVSTPTANGYYLKFILQRRYPLWPFWKLIYEGNESEEEYVRNRMKDAISIARKRKTTIYIYHTDQCPPHIPREQKDKYLVKANKNWRNSYI